MKCSALICARLCSVRSIQAIQSNLILPYPVCNFWHFLSCLAGLPVVTCSSLHALPCPSGSFLHFPARTLLCSHCLSCSIYPILFLLYCLSCPVTAMSWQGCSTCPSCPHLHCTYPVHMFLHAMLSLPWFMCPPCPLLFCPVISSRPCPVLSFASCFVSLFRLSCLFSCSAILHCPILPCPIRSCPVLSCLALPCLALFSLSLFLLSYPIMLCPVLSYFALSGIVLFCCFLSYLTLYLSYLCLTMSSPVLFSPALSLRRFVPYALCFLFYLIRLALVDFPNCALFSPKPCSLVHRTRQETNGYSTK